MLILCKCGCNNYRESIDKQGRNRYFIFGHNKSTINKNKKKIYKCFTCNKEYQSYTKKSKRRFCSKICQYNFKYPGCIWKGKNGYLYFQRGRKYKVLLHRELLNNPEGIVHHKDGNKLNNNLENLDILNNQSSHIKIHNPILYRWTKLNR